jgi:predicted RNA-binding Zn ribbon-like protein
VTTVAASFAELNLRLAVELVNRLTPPPPDPEAVLREVLAFDPPSAAALRRRDVPALVALAGRLRGVFDAVAAGDVDGAAGALNALLAEHPAHPHLAHDGERWRLHHHPANAALVPWAGAVTADALARVVDERGPDRLGTCAAPDCDLVYVDGSKNGSRRFCSTTCQNRVKAAAFRRRRSAR